MLNKPFHSEGYSELYKNDTVNSITPSGSDTDNDNDTDTDTDTYNDNETQTHVTKEYIETNESKESYGSTEDKEPIDKKESIELNESKESTEKKEISLEELKKIYKILLDENPHLDTNEGTEIDRDYLINKIRSEVDSDLTNFIHISKHYNEFFTDEDIKDIASFLIEGPINEYKYSTNNLTDDRDRLSILIQNFEVFKDFIDDSKFLDSFNPRLIYKVFVTERKASYSSKSAIIDILLAQNPKIFNKFMPMLYRYDKGFIINYFSDNVDTVLNKFILPYGYKIDSKYLEFFIKIKKDKNEPLGDALYEIISKRDDTLKYLPISNIPKKYQESLLTELLSMLPENTSSKINVENSESIDKHLGLYPFILYYDDLINSKINNYSITQMVKNLYKRFATKKNAILLDQMLEAAIKGDTNRWKYGENEEDFEDMKKKGWLPYNLTYDQYTLWKFDRSQSFHEVFSSDSKSTREAILTNLENHIRSDNLGLNQLLNDLKTILEIADEKDFMAYSIEELEDFIKKIGALTAKEIDGPNKQQLFLKLHLLINIKKLSEIRDEDILNGNTGKILNSIYQYFENNADSKLHIIENLKLPYQDYKDRISNTNIDPKNNVSKDETHNAKKTSNVNKNAVSRIAKDSALTVEDTSNLAVALRIGEVPIETCQHYESGGYNKGLLGYTEPHVKIIIVRDNDGNIIARAILRLLEQKSTRDPCIFVEPTYSSSSLSSIRPLILEHANNISKELNIPFYLSELYGDKYKLNEDSSSVSQEKLIIKNIRAPSIYSDTARERLDTKVNIKNFIRYTD